MRTLLLCLVLSATAYAQKAIGYQVVADFPGSPTERQVVIKSDTLWTWRGGEWRLLRVPYAFVSEGGVGSVDTAVIATQNDLHTEVDSVKANRAYVGHTHPGGSDPWTVYRRTADTTKSTNTPVNVGGMEFNVTNGTTYTFYFLLIYQTAATTTGLKTTITAPAGTLVAYATHYGHAADGVGTPWAGTINSSGDVVTSTAVAVANANYMAVIEGTFIATANGTLNLQWGPEVAAAATLKAGSHRMYRSVP